MRGGEGVSKPAPYPADTRAKGWRFELDLERVQQSDTWALAEPEARPWLLMLWCTAWQQAPCGSLPSDERILCARIGIPSKLWAKHRDVLLRGWEAHDDGRLYHAVITAQVVGMLTKKAEERQRKADYRARMDAERRGSPEVVPRDKTGTGEGRTPDSDGRDDTGTGTGTSTGREDYGSNDPPSSAREVRPEVAVSIALRRAGIQANADHPRLMALCEAGATVGEFMALLPAAEGAANPFAYLLGAVEGERKRAAATAGQLHRGAMPNKQEALEARNKAVGLAWLAKQESA